MLDIFPPMIKKQEENEMWFYRGAPRICAEQVTNKKNRIIKKTCRKTTAEISGKYSEERRPGDSK